MLTFKMNNSLAANFKPVQTSNPVVVATLCPQCNFINEELILRDAVTVLSLDFAAILVMPAINAAHARMRGEKSVKGYQLHCQHLYCFY